MTIIELAQKHIADLKPESSRSWAGPCPQCGGNDRFVVGGKKDIFHCRGCGISGDDVGLLRLVGYSCPEAHEELGRTCDSTTCPADRCRVRRGGAGPARPRPAKPLQAPEPAAAPQFDPAAALAPEERWRARAAKLIDVAHAALLDCPERLDYLARRGLPREAVCRYRLGWLAKDYYRPRSAWGLPQALRDDGKPKKLWLPAGIVIPFFDTAGAPVRIRIRRDHVQPGQNRYYWVPGSGDDVPVLGADARAFVVVESDLDAFLVHYHAGHLVGAIPLGTSHAKPKQGAAAALQRALAILVAHDVDANHAGGKAGRWWLQHYPQAKRWPVPAGKDPGEYVEHHGGDIRAWVLAGLPPVFHVQPSEADPAPAVEETAAEPQEVDPEEYVLGVSKGGIPYLVASTPDVLAHARQAHPEAVPFLEDELRHLKGYTAEEAHHVLLAKRAFPEGRVVGSRPVAADPPAGVRAVLAPPQPPN